MKKTFSIFLFLLGAIQLLAQDQYNVGFFYANPIGNFGKNELEKGGFAQPGWGIMFEDKARSQGWPQNLFLGIHVSYQQNEMDREAIESEYDHAFDELYNNALDLTTTVEAGKVKPLTITFGPYYDIPIGEKVLIELKSGLGIMLSNFDPVRISLFNQNNFITRETYFFESSPVFTYFLGLNMGYKISPNTKLSVFAEHASATEKMSISNDNNEVINNGTKQDISYLNLGLSLGIYFK